MEFDIHDKKKAEQLPPMYFNMVALSQGLSRQVPNKLHQTPSYNIRSFYKPLTSVVSFPKRTSSDE